MYLQKARYTAPNLCSLLVHFLKQPEGIDTVYQVYERCNVLYLVALQMTYEVPSDVVGQFLMLDYKVLRLALTEFAVSCVIGGLDGFCRVVFGYSN